MAKEKPNKWTRERGFLELHGGDIGVVLAALFFLCVTVTIVFFAWRAPAIPGLTAPEATDAAPPPGNQILHLAPGETVINIAPAKPRVPKDGQKKP